MKKRLMTKSELSKKFSNDIIEGTKMNFLVGGDGDGGQTSPPDPWIIKP
jgi:hypothetical protein